MLPSLTAPSVTHQEPKVERLGGRLLPLSLLAPPRKMSVLPRSAKSASDWTRHELEAYNITVTSIAPDAFFGTHLNSATLDDIDNDMFSGSTEDDGKLSNQTLEYLQELNLASRANSGQESAIHGFTTTTLKLCRYNERNLLLRSRHTIPFLVSEELKSAQPDITLVHFRSATILLVIQEDKSDVGPGDPEVQVIAHAIAAFQHNNAKRQSTGNRPLDYMMIPAITMICAKPMFYLVPVTSELAAAVHHGQAGPSETRVRRCPVPTRRLIDGMEVPSYRKVAFRHFKAFRELAKSHWAAAITDLLD